MTLGRFVLAYEESVAGLEKMFPFAALLADYRHIQLAGLVASQYPAAVNLTRYTPV